MQYTTDGATISYYPITHNTVHSTSKLTTQPLSKISEPKEVDCCTWLCKPSRKIWKTLPLQSLSKLRLEDPAEKAFHI